MKKPTPSRSSRAARRFRRPPPGTARVTVWSGPTAIPDETEIPLPRFFDGGLREVLGLPPRLED
jgi:hypothetical protein